MPRLPATTPLTELSHDRRAMLFDEPFDKVLPYVMQIEAAPDENPQRDLWMAHRQAVLAEWVIIHPGTRPSFWWLYDAPRWRTPAERREWYYVKQKLLPEPRRRLGGKGDPSFEVSATSPHWPLGIPTPWETIDADDRPRFESQAAYLKRYGLFLPGEEERLTAADFEPEVVDERPQEIIAFCKKHGIL
jgi:hypothetical protein